MAVHNFTVTVAAAGSPQQLSSTPQKANWIQLIPDPDNTGSEVYTGGAGLTPANGLIVGSGQGFLYPPAGNSNCYALTDIYVDVATSGDKVQGIYNTI